MDCFRYPHTMNERKQYYKSPHLVRAKRKEKKLWFACDDFDRPRLRSWKDQSKKRRQHGYHQQQIQNIKSMSFDQAIAEEKKLLSLNER